MTLQVTPEQIASIFIAAGLNPKSDDDVDAFVNALTAPTEDGMKQAATLAASQKTAAARPTDAEAKKAKLTRPAGVRETTGTEDLDQVFDALEASEEIKTRKFAGNYGPSDKELSGAETIEKAFLAYQAAILEKVNHK